jgi:predicted Rossmann fold nucleotide-binding protein DprA/Smf involved in DNA uptake
MAADQMVALAAGAAGYPANLRAIAGFDAPPVVTARGNVAILAGKTLAVFCSVRCPGSLIVRTLDLAAGLRAAEITAVSGFHAPVERECLRLLLRGEQPVVACPAREIVEMRLPADWREPVARGRLLLVSPFGAGERRVTAATAWRRNLFVAALADAVLVIHASPGGRLERLCATALGWGKRVLALAGPENAALLALGAQAVREDATVGLAVEGERGAGG